VLGRSGGKRSTGPFSDPPHPFGGIHTSTGALPTARFPGQWFQSESGLHQNWMRDYDPTTGRYLQADPLGLVDGASVYGYAVQSPMWFTDPRGLWVVGPQSVAPPDFNPYTDDLVQCGGRDDCYRREGDEKNRCEIRYARGEIKNRRGCIERATIRRDMCIRGIKVLPPEWGKEEDYDPDEPYIPEEPSYSEGIDVGNVLTGIGLGLLAIGGYFVSTVFVF
jgi:RHS repeat-associated protein